jgi:hypothetical protein
MDTSTLWHGIQTIQCMYIHFSQTQTLSEICVPSSCVPPTLSTYPLTYLLDLFTPRSQREKIGMDRMNWFVNQGSGYFAEQSTQPQTLGYSFADSPVGLLGWIYEKMVNWTDDYPWTDDEVLTWVSIYWFSRAGPAASVRIYYEVTQAGERTPPPSQRPTIPMGISLFPKELRHFPWRWVLLTRSLD